MPPQIRRGGRRGGSPSPSSRLPIKGRTRSSAPTNALFGRLPLPRMPADRFIAFDLGAESGRAVVGTLENSKLSLAETHRFANPTGKINGHLHWNLLAQWEELKTGLRKSCAVADSIRGVGIDTW